MAAVASIEVAIEFESPKLIRFQSHLRLKNTLSILLLLACLTLQLHAQEMPAETFEVAGHSAYVRGSPASTAKFTLF